VFEFPMPTPDSGVPSGALILIAMIMGMVIYGVWYAVAGADRNAVQVIQEVPDRLSALLNPAAAPPAETPAAAPAPEEMTTEDGTDVPVDTPPGETPTAGLVPETGTAPDADIPVSTDGPPVEQEPADVVELRAKADVWITLKVAEQVDRTQLLKKGEVFRAPEGGGGMTLVTAKPGDLEILVNGTVMPALDAGVFAKGVPLDPDHLKGPTTP
ncbi:MAG: hypothetical protein K2P94_06125, partial [Rhodospirillaceae bacterium]|nr:hypothetical protein [Rhodospirillaceae bacterium]